MFLVSRNLSKIVPLGLRSYGRLNVNHNLRGKSRNTFFKKIESRKFFFTDKE